MILCEIRIRDGNFADDNRIDVIITTFLLKKLLINVGVDSYLFHRATWETGNIVEGQTQGMN